MRKIIHRFSLDQFGDAELCTPEVQLLGPEATLETIPNQPNPNYKRPVDEPRLYAPDVLCITLEDGSAWHVNLDELRRALAPPAPTRLTPAEVEDILARETQRHSLYVNSRWEHTESGNLYWLVAVALDTESKAVFVAYRSHGATATFTRSLESFLQKFKLVSRRVDG